MTGKKKKLAWLPDLLRLHHLKLPSLSLVSLLTGFVLWGHCSVAQMCSHQQVGELKDHVCCRGIYGGYYSLELAAHDLARNQGMALGPSHLPPPVELLKPTGSLGRRSPFYSSMPSWPRSSPILPPAGDAAVARQRERERPEQRWSVVSSYYRGGYIQDGNVPEPIKSRLQLWGASVWGIMQICRSPFLIYL